MTEQILVLFEREDSGVGELTSGTHYVLPDGIEAFLRGVEAVAVDAALDPAHMQEPCSRSCIPDNVTAATFPARSAPVSCNGGRP